MSVNDDGVVKVRGVCSTTTFTCAVADCISISFAFVLVLALFPMSRRLDPAARYGNILQFAFMTTATDTRSTV